MTSIERSVCLGFLACAFASAGSVLAHNGWPFDLLAQFQAQIALSSLLLLVLLCVFRRWGLALVAGFLFAFSVWKMDIGSNTRFAAASTSADAAVKVVTANLFGRSGALDRLSKVHGREEFDLLVLTELPVAADDALLSRFPDMTHIAGTPRQALFGLPSAVILSRSPPQHVEILRVNENPSAITKARYCFESQANCLTTFAIHPLPPITPSLYERQKAILEEVARQLQETDGAALVAGDFNAVSWSPLMTAFRRRGDVRKVACGARWSPTWLAPFPGVGLELDHIFVNGGVMKETCEVGAFLWSDHWPVISELVLIEPGAD
ncbi:MAG: endonuclease/exonuclease/phosphatase family protein [Roseibium sp.]|uniref:endonuclease/exonuclease/phosphatase family protein n=1 Tax=Roseibium sp. TaxID=1936156 RepID=UPI003D9C44C0